MAPGKGREGELGVIKNAAVEVDGGKIIDVIARPLPAGRQAKGTKQSPARKCVHGIASSSTFGGLPRNDTQVLNARGSVVLPGLIDCHTHLVHAGSRADEFAMRARGASYEDIAKAGGGIMSTVRATRAAGEDELFERAKARAQESLSHGVTTIEVKSGYGLDSEAELKMLRVVKCLGEEFPQEFVPTFLAHMVPKDLSFLPRVKARGKLQQESHGNILDPRFRGDDRQDYINFIIHQLLPEIAKEKLAKFCDVFVEKIAFTKAEAEEILKAAAKYGLQAKLHADQLSSNGGAVLAAKLKAVSADHLEHISKKDMRALAKSGTIAVLIPSSTFFIGGPARQSSGACPPVVWRGGRYAPAREIIGAGIDVAISTDYNPGTSPMQALMLQFPRIIIRERRRY
ncbi:MAG: amidohydrolase family protein [Deltaproteobacteria bacterium]|nr:amidohydrolase family protein [Deltaproteobacteria bacterium]